MWRFPLVLPESLTNKNPLACQRVFLHIEFIPMNIDPLNPLNLGITVAVDNGVDLALLLTVRTIFKRVCLIVRHILRRKNRVNVYATHLGDRAKDSGNANDIAPVIFDTLRCV